jgi:colicin import membrane protein
MPANQAPPVNTVKADLDTLIWLIIFVMVALAKGWSKLQQSIDKDSTESKEAPPVAPVRRQPRPPPPVARTAPRTARLPVGPPPREAWRVDPEQVRRFIEQLSGKPQPVPPPPVAPPPVRKMEAARPRPAPPERPEQPPKPEPAAAAPVAKPPIPASPMPAPTPRAALWAEALRDKQNIRNIIISAEIIGPPKVFQ